MNTSKTEKFPQTFSSHFQAADDLKAVEYVLPYVSAHFTHPPENKVRPDQIVQGAILMELHANSVWQQPALCFDGLDHS